MYAICLQPPIKMLGVSFLLKLMLCYFLPHIWKEEATTQLRGGLILKFYFLRCPPQFILYTSQLNKSPLNLKKDKQLQTKR